MGLVMQVAEACMMPCSMHSAVMCHAASTRWHHDPLPLHAVLWCYPLRATACIAFGGGSNLVQGQKAPGAQCCHPC